MKIQYFFFFLFIFIYHYITDISLFFHEKNFKWKKLNKLFVFFFIILYYFFFLYINTLFFQSFSYILQNCIFADAVHQNEVGHTCTFFKIFHLFFYFCEIDGKWTYLKGKNKDWIFKKNEWKERMNICYFLKYFF